MQPRLVLTDHGVDSAASEPAEPERILADARLLDACWRDVVSAAECLSGVRAASIDGGGPAQWTGPGEGGTVIAINGKRWPASPRCIGY